MKKPEIIVDKLHASIDEELDLQVTNCKPNEKITLKAKVSDDQGKVFESMASFITNEHGSVSLFEAKPVKGSYDEFPSIPSNVIMQVDQRMSMNFGGSKAANARATIDSWKKIREFLKTVHTQS